MYLGYMFFLYVLYLSFERMYEISLVSIIFRSAWAKIVDLIQTVFQILHSGTNLIRASTCSKSWLVVNAEGTLRRWAGTSKRYSVSLRKIKDTLRAMFVHPYCRKIGDIPKVVSRSAGFN